MIDSNKIGLQFIQGSEENILNQSYREGFLYFATDTKRIFMDAKGNSKMLMGGSSGIHYGSMVLSETPDKGQKEFYFSIFDIEGNKDADTLKIPNIDDLILNEPDGCFYRVKEVNGEEDDIEILTYKLTIAGSGSNSDDPSVGPSSKAKASMDRIGKRDFSVLKGQSCQVGFTASATDASGETTGDGTYVLIVGGVTVGRGIVKQGENYIPIQDFLVEGTNKVAVYIYMDIGEDEPESLNKKWTVQVSSINISWEQKQLTPHNINEPLTLEWSISGKGISKLPFVIIDDIHKIELDRTTDTNISLTFNPTDYGLTHKAYKIEVGANVEIEEFNLPVESKVKNFMFKEEGNTSPIISVDLFNTNLKQYTTTEIPIKIYSEDNITGNAIVTLLEDKTVKDTWENVKNNEIKIWYYTPTKSGIFPLVVTCGQVSSTHNINVQAVDIDNEEVEGYVFKFRADNFASNTAVKNWDSKGVKATFSSDFDWVNGGLKSEVDENKNNRQYMCIKAGSTMTIDYNLFSIPASLMGKTFKIIFKTKNCKDFNANALSCKKDVKKVKIKNDYPIVLDILNGSTIKTSKDVVINNSLLELDNPIDEIVDLFSADVQKLFNNKYILYNNIIYYCSVKEVENVDPTQYYFEGSMVYIKDTFEGLQINAQNAEYNSASSTISTQYCEDEYIELELDITEEQDKKRYIKFWVDGVPSGFVVYPSQESFAYAKNEKIIIGSEECDVHIYMIKLYERALSNDEHLQNFIADAPNAEEMIARYNRNNILIGDNISPGLVAKNNPDCLVHVYELTAEGMTTAKADSKQGCKYKQYKGSENARFSAENVTIKVQGTSSERYVMAAANLDSDFTEGFIDNTGKHFDKWSMDDGSAIPLDFFCTKVNVASCENANNAMNQEWYNMFQPYPTIVKYKNPKARDTMQFTNGVMFIIDNNPTWDVNSSNKLKNNLFGEIEGYLDKPYARFYSLAQMGNSKDNVEVFHDSTNDLECCVEVSDNQQPQQWMTSDDYKDSDIDAGEEYYGFRYPKKLKGVSTDTATKLKNNWRDFVSWMAHSNPQPMYEEHSANNEKEYRSFGYNPKTLQNITTYVLENRDGKLDYYESEYNPEIIRYFTKTTNQYGYTNLPLDQPVAYGDYTFKGYKCETQVDENGQPYQKDYNPLIAGCMISDYNSNNFIKTPNPIDQNVMIANTDGFTHDTYEYRMAKMLHECEEHLCMDSVIYHYLFIERHCMIDNVAKNTFWSTEDGKVWNLTKNYDNDTADGNDNQGKFTRTYGMEVLDDLNEQVKVFNAHESVWLNFIHGIKTARQHMYNAIAEKKKYTYGDKILHAWNKDDYLWFFKQWQSKIPERCWIEDYQRKYFRPYELYGSTTFIGMMEGGQKTHQRRQFETYQHIYMDSEYWGADTTQSFIDIRPNGDNMLGAKLAVETYSDCYINMTAGSSKFSKRVKKNQKDFFVCPVNKINNATMPLYPANVMTKLGSLTEGEGTVGDYYPERLEVNNASKLRELVVSHGNAATSNYSLKEGLSISGNPMLEKVYLANLNSYEGDLNLSNCPSLKYLDARGSGFTAIEFADSAPLQSIALDSPTSLKISNSNKLENLSITTYANLHTLNLNNIDNGKISSLELLNKCQGLRTYKLTNIKWTLDDELYINKENNTIAPLERLLRLETLPNKEYTDSNGGYEPKQISLTGNINVTSKAYKDNKSINIYNNYVNKDSYPNIDISFEDDASKLYNVIILDGNDNIYWKRRIQKNNNINDEFLNDGPSGKFNIDGVFKPSTYDKVYTFTGTWFVYDNEDNKIATISNTLNNMPYFENVEKDIIIKPQFNVEERYYTVNFYTYNTTTGKVDAPLETNIKVKYGTILSEIYPDVIPWKPDAIDYDLKEANVFKGYGLSEDNVLPDTYSISTDLNLYAIFEKVKDITQVIHYDWFDYHDYTYRRDQDFVDQKYPNDIFPNGQPLGEVAGYLITKKEGIKLRGKITIPSFYNGKPIVAIGPQFAHTEDEQNHRVTHIFFEKNSKVYEIQKEAFWGNRLLQYFDFTQNTIRFIQEAAFQNCDTLNPETTVLSNQLYYVGLNAFNGAFAATSPTIIKIPGSVSLIEQYGFANMNKCEKGVVMQIGSEEEPSRVYGLYPSVDDTNIQKFVQNDSGIHNFVFYSKRYKTDDEYLSESIQVFRMFVKTSQSKKDFQITMYHMGV